MQQSTGSTVNTHAARANGACRGLALCAALLLGACGSPTLAQPQPAPAAAAAAAVSVYKALGSRQCGEAGTPRVEFERQLGAAGIPVLASACGSDGRMRTAMCGAPDGRIAIFDVPAERAAAAAAAGFEPLNQLPDATREACAGR